MSSTGSTPDASRGGSSVPRSDARPAETALPYVSDSRILVIGGHYGSGKTEIALNLAIALRPSAKRLALIDLDIVNPFFRSAEQGALLKEHDIELLKPIYANTGVDIPSLPPEIRSVFVRDELRAIFDVGGDDAGAAALGGYAPQFQRVDKAFYMVVNPFRPRSATIDQIVAMYEAISIRARMKPEAFIANPNLGGETTAADIAQGLAVVREAAGVCDVPVAFLCAQSTVAEQVSGFGLPVFPLLRYLKPEWMEL